MTYIKKPKNITDKSFEIIEEEIREDFPGHEFSSKLEEEIVKRCIHTSADFDYLKNIKINHDADKKIQEAIKNASTIITDTNMALAGINKKILDEYGTSYHCFVKDDRAYKIAEEKGITRSMAAVDLAASLDGPKVFVVGNAPTAIFRLMDLVEEGGVKDLVGVVACPVGFVGAAESKDLIHQSSIPSIAALGRKGGSNIAAAIINAIQYNIIDELGIYEK